MIMRKKFKKDNNSFEISSSSPGKIKKTKIIFGEDSENQVLSKFS